MLSNPNKADESPQIMHQMELARALLEGIGDDDEARFVLIDDADPDVVASRLRDTKPGSKVTAAPFSPLGSPRGMTRLAMRGLAEAQKIDPIAIPLPEGAPYGRVDIDTDNCTICLHVSAHARRAHCRTTPMRRNCCSAKTPACSAASAWQPARKRSSVLYRSSILPTVP